MIVSGNCLRVNCSKWELSGWDLSVVWVVWGESLLFQCYSNFFGSRKIDHISKTKSRKNHKIVFSFVSEHFITFWKTKNPIWPLLREGGGGREVVCMSLTRNTLDISLYWSNFPILSILYWSRFPIEIIRFYSILYWSNFPIETVT